MANELVRVGTRGSLLARTQTLWVMDQLRACHSGLRLVEVIIRTSGDERTHEVPARVAGKGFFTKEIEDALLAGAVDLAVHSLKDLPASCPDGLMLGAIPPREDPRDVLVGCTTAQLLRIPERVVLGTSSLRRQAQLRRAFKGCRIVNLRGNLDTRLRKTRDGTVDGAVLAAAGLRRLRRQDEISDYFAPTQMLPAAGQGALALEIRQDDTRLRELLSAIHCTVSSRCVYAERAFMHELGGGCQLPVAALGVADGERLLLRARVLSLDGTECFDGQREGRTDQPEKLGRELAASFLARGAGKLIREIERQLGEDVDNE
ncbi:MAG: hydroxymethylbilane synthase [Kiritimatiellaeota bacterium]|nr:hydroxymethylbilane synthase [Kiritimatiellota bacterium]